MYYNGWSRVESPAQSGVTIHHPNGDIKKITTYTEPLTNGAFANNRNSQLEGVLGHHRKRCCGNRARLLRIA
ncbi:MAG: hypothetical protein U5L09_22835 [Bacteroidales bacterium]|nr:hypothetical protein [Bacteroidales bacterium]